MTCRRNSGNHSPVRKSRKKCKKSQFRSRKSGYCRKKKCGSGRTRDKVTGFCRKKKSSRKSPKRKSRSIKSRRIKSPKRKSPKSKSRSRKSSTRKSRSRKPPCGVGMILNKSTGKCRVKCVPGKTTRIRSKSGRCRKIKSSTRKSRSRKSRSRKSRSRKSSPAKKLPKCTKPGQTRSRKSGRCRVPPCPPGMIRNKSNGKCRMKCSPGRIRGPTGRCIKRPKKSKTSSDETDLTNSGTRAFGSGSTINDIHSWHRSGHMFPNSSGFTPPPGRKNDFIPAWQAAPASKPFRMSSASDSDSDSDSGDNFYTKSVQDKTKWWDSKIRSESPQAGQKFSRTSSSSSYSPRSKRH